MRGQINVSAGSQPVCKCTMHYRNSQCCDDWQCRYQQTPRHTGIWQVTTDSLVLKYSTQFRLNSSVFSCIWPSTCHPARHHIVDSRTCDIKPANLLYTVRASHDYCQPKPAYPTILTWVMQHDTAVCPTKVYTRVRNEFRTDSCTTF
jgi:hypothetical protein